MSAIDIIKKALEAAEVTPVTPSHMPCVTAEPMQKQTGNTGNTGNTQKTGSTAPSEVTPPATRVRLHLVVGAGDKQKSVSMLGAIEQTYEQASDSARCRFGDRLISVQEAQP